MQTASPWAQLDPRHRPAAIHWPADKCRRIGSGRDADEEQDPPPPCPVLPPLHLTQRGQQARVRDLEVLYALRKESMRERPLAICLGWPVTSVRHVLFRLERQGRARRSADKVWSAIERDDLDETEAATFPGEPRDLPAYRALGFCGTATVTEIAIWSQRPRNTVQTSICRLHKRGLVRKAGKARWAPVDLHSVLRQPPRPRSRPIGSATAIYAQIIEQVRAGRADALGIAEALGKAPNTIYTAAQVLIKRGQLVRIGNGPGSLVEAASQHAEPPLGSSAHLERALLGG